MPPLMMNPVAVSVPISTSRIEGAIGRAGWYDDNAGAIGMAVAIGASMEADTAAIAGFSWCDDSKASGGSQGQ